MMSEYSIELQSEKIFNSKTKKYFQEVLSSYINGNFRSALVMLWTVTVTDLVFKLQDLSNIYKDESAEKILLEIEKIQNDNPTSPQWEADLIDLIKKRTKMFESYEITHIESLHKQRHLSAHPIIKDTVELYQPNKETVRAYIRNILENVLTKPPYASGRIFEVLITDLSEKKDLFPDYKELIHYVQSAYLKNMPVHVIKNIYKKLWKFVFKLNDENIQINREINLRVLGVLIEKYENDIIEFMAQEVDYFGQNISLEDDQRLEYIVLLCQKYPKIYSSIAVSYQNPLKQKIFQINKLHSLSTFLYENATTFIDAMKNIIGLDEFRKHENAAENALEFCKEFGKEKQLLEVFIDKFISSGSYDAADINFEGLIEPCLNDFDKELLEKMLLGINNNDQIFNRKKSKNDHIKIKKTADNILGNDYDYSNYDNFIESIED